MYPSAKFPQKAQRHSSYHLIFLLAELSLNCATDEDPKAATVLIACLHLLVLSALNSFNEESPQQQVRSLQAIRETATDLM